MTQALATHRDDDEARTLTRISDLVAAGLVAPDDAPGLESVAARYAVAVTPTVRALMGSGADDPIARQYLPDPRELKTTPEERTDPIGDNARSPVPGLVHRYPDRVLLKLVTACAVYCRFCFRREMVGPGGETMLAPGVLARALDYVRSDPGIWEVIVTGGDPFVVAPRRLASVMADLAAIPHIQVLRWHTRVPMVAPERITPELVGVLRGSRLAPYVAIHANHPDEFTPAVTAALARLADAGIVLVSQSVLLRGINDDVDTLARLMRSFVAHRVKPYYLHQADLAPGTSHWRVDIAEGRRLVAALRGRLSGLAQPTYVLDIPGGHGKAPLGRDHLSPDGKAVRDPDGTLHPYPPAP